MVKIFLLQHLQRWGAPQANGVVVDVHRLTPLAVLLLRLGYHALFNELVNDF